MNDLVSELYDKIDRLENQKKELKTWLEEQKDNRKYDNDVCRYTAYDYVLSKLNEIEGGKNE